MRIYIDYEHSNGDFGFYKLFYDNYFVEFGGKFDDLQHLLDKKYKSEDLTLCILRVGWGYRLSQLLKAWGYQVEELEFHNYRTILEGSKDCLEEL